MVKNQITELEIKDITAEGNGIGRADGMAVFVPSAAVGDIVKCRIVKVCKSFCYGIIEEIITPSADRITDTGCSVYPKCGGCIFRHINYDAELRIKENIVKSAFERIGKIKTEFEPILGCNNTERYRNKAQYPVAEINGKAVFGFYAARSHRVIPCGNCRLQPDIFSDIASFVIEYVNKHHIPLYNENSGSGIIRHIYLRRGEHSGEIMLCIVSAKKGTGYFEKLAKDTAMKYPFIKSIVLNINSDNTNVILGKKFITLYGKDHIIDEMCGNKIKISPQSFYQVNTLQAEKLYSIAKEYAQPQKNDLLLDLYCGTGTVGLSFAKDTGRIIGCEIIREAVANARENAALNGIVNAEFICGDASEIALEFADKGLHPEIIVTDPPRKGCDSTALESVAKMSPGKLVMISCNPSTAARDAAVLESFGYKTVKVRAVDMFPRTGHVECVIMMCRRAGGGA